MTKFKTSPNSKHVTQKLKFVLKRIENVGKERNAGTQKVFLFP